MGFLEESQAVGVWSSSVEGNWHQNVVIIVTVRELSHSVYSDVCRLCICLNFLIFLLLGIIIIIAY